jgi:hypothetical protein
VLLGIPALYRGDCAGQRHKNTDTDTRPTARVATTHTHTHTHTHTCIISYPQDLEAKFKSMVDGKYVGVQGGPQAITDAR